jgi:hypothetical protein
MGRRRPDPPPFCRCGCKQRVLRRTREYLGGHVPSALRAMGGQKGGRRRAWAARVRKFDEQFGELTRHGRTITKEAIMDAFANIYRHAYNVGYQAGEYKWTHGKYAPRRAA